MAVTLIPRRDPWVEQPQRSVPVDSAWKNLAVGVYSGVSITENLAKGGFLGDGAISGTVGQSFGLAGTAATFASSAHVPLDATNFLLGTARDFAIFAVVRRQSAQLYRFAIRASSSATYDLTTGIGCEYSGSGKIVFNIGLKNYDEYEVAEVTQLTDGETATYLGTWDATNQIASLYKDGVLQNTLNYTSGSNSPRSIPISIGNDPSSTAGRNWNGDVFLAGFIDGYVDASAARELGKNPWLLLEPDVIWIPLTASGGGGVTGTAAVTLAGDTSSATGTTTVKGTSAVTLQNAASSAAGTVGSVTGTAAITLAGATSSAQGTTSIGGTGAVTLGNDTATASGAVGSAITGSAAITLGGDTSSAQGTTKILGSAAITLGADFSTTQGTTKILGSAAVTLGDDFATAFGTAGTPTTVASPRGLTIRIGLAL